MDFVFQQVQKAFQANDKEIAHLELEEVDLFEFLAFKKVTPELVSFVTSCFPQKTQVDFLVGLINLHNDHLAEKVAPKLPVNKITSKTWVILKDIVEEDDEAVFLKKFVKENAIKRPYWVKKFKEVPLPEVPDTLPTPHEALQLLSDHFGKFVTEGDARETFISQYSLSTVIEKIQLLSEVKELELVNDIPLFREYGPVNTLFSLVKHTSDHPCSRNGGCRMFLCNEFEEEEDENEISDWFTGTCEECSASISHFWYALRMPLKHGGWKGCFCSFRCLLEKGDPVIIEKLKEQIETICIRDQGSN